MTQRNFLVAGNANVGDVRPRAANRVRLTRQWVLNERC